MTTLSSTSGASPPITPADPARARLHKAAQGFEAVFVRQMLQAAHQTNFGDTLWGNDPGHDTFAAMRDERYADIASQTGTIGLAQQIEKQLAGRAGSAAPAQGGSAPK
jgi:flagellar protein FlgJ